ncbi:MAG: hypothetical protein MUP17_01095 [candidate division Zixibacteria bacterium]|nr:hypothetical protein [candidate division Zixibacteria bacterium]
MRKLILSLTILTIIIMPNAVHAGNKSVISYSPTNITHSMDLAVRSNSLYYSYVQETIASDTINKKVVERKPAKLKSPTKALVIALVPGSVVHGAGHFYAGKTKTAFVLFGAEIIGAGMAFFGAAGWSVQGDTGGDGSLAGPVVLFLGLGLFTGSWIYDVAVSPSVVKNQNDKILGKEPFEQ